MWLYTCCLSNLVRFACPCFPQQDHELVLVILYERLLIGDFIQSTSRIHIVNFQIECFQTVYARSHIQAVIFLPYVIYTIGNACLVFLHDNFFVANSDCRLVSYTPVPHIVTESTRAPLSSYSQRRRRPTRALRTCLTISCFNYPLICTPLFNTANRTTPITLRAKLSRLRACSAIEMW